MSINHVPPVHEAPAPRGRPFDYSEELVTRLLDRIAETDESVRQICKLPGYPSRQTVTRWCQKFPEFSTIYHLTLAGRCDDMLMEGLEIADNGDRDWTPQANEDGVVTITENREHITRTKQRLDYRVTIAGKLASKAAPGPQGPGPSAAPGVDGALLLDQRVLEGHQLRPYYAAYERALAERR